MYRNELFCLARARSLVILGAALPVCALLAVPAAAGPIALKVVPEQSSITFTITNFNATGPATATAGVSGTPPIDGLLGDLSAGIGQNVPGLLDITGGGLTLANAATSLSFGAGGSLALSLQGVHVYFEPLSGLLPSSTSPGDPGSATYDLASNLTFTADAGLASYSGTGSYGSQFGKITLPLEILGPLGFGTPIEVTQSSSGHLTAIMPILGTFTIYTTNLGAPSNLDVQLSGQVVFTSVPEPSTLALGLCAALGLGAALYRRRRHR